MQRSPHFLNKSCSQRSECHTELNEICGKDNPCQCMPGHQYNFNGDCISCPGLGGRCTDCCGDSSLTCIANICTCANGGTNAIACNGQPTVFITASQIALSVALIMGMAALAMVIYRLCTKPRYLSARAAANLRRAQEQNLDTSYASYLRSSLTSIQIRVLTRMRDRPPTYDSRQSMVVQQVQESPPSYEGSVNLDIHLPPPYAEIILSPTGYLNTGYVDNETTTIARDPRGSLSNNNNSEAELKEQTNPS